MPIPTPTPEPNYAGAIIAAGGAGLLFAAVLAVGGFFLSAWLMGWWLRILVASHRSWFNREYARVRGAYVPTRADRAPKGKGSFERRWDDRTQGPRDW